MNEIALSKLDFYRHEEHGTVSDETRELVLDHLKQQQYQFIDENIFSNDQEALFESISISYSKNLVYDYQGILELYNNNPDICSNLFHLRLDWLKWYETSYGIYKVNISTIKKRMNSDFGIEKIEKRTIEHNKRLILEHHLDIRIYDNVQLVIQSIRKKSGKFISAFIHILLKRYLADKIIADLNQRQNLQYLVDLLEKTGASKFKPRVLPKSFRDANKLIGVIDDILKKHNITLQSNIIGLHKSLKRKRTKELIKSSEQSVTQPLQQSDVAECSVHSDSIRSLMDNFLPICESSPQVVSENDSIALTPINAHLEMNCQPYELPMVPLEVTPESNHSGHGNRKTISDQTTPIIICGANTINNSNILLEDTNVPTDLIVINNLTSDISHTQLLADCETGEWRLFSNSDLETRDDLDICSSSECIEIIATQHNNIEQHNKSISFNHRVTLKNNSRLHCCFNVIIQLLLSVTCVRDKLFVDCKTISERLLRMKQTLKSKPLHLPKAQKMMRKSVFLCMISLHELAARFFKPHSNNNTRRSQCENGSQFINQLQNLAFHLGDSLQSMEQHDASEILGFFRQNVVSATDESNKLYFEDFSNKFDILFEFELQYKAPLCRMLCCNSVFDNTSRSLIEYSINLKFTADKPTKQATLSKCLFAAFNSTDERLRCENLNCFVRDTVVRSSSNTFVSTPAVLLLIIPRKDNYLSKKINSTFITYPTSWYVEDIFQSTPSLHDPVLYRLTAVIDRTGLYNSGHYEIDILDDTGTVMYNYNDSTLTSYDFHDETSVRSSTANILVYEKQAK